MDGDLLLSMGLGQYYWGSGENRASCRHGFRHRAPHHRAPHHECECGLYARYDHEPSWNNVVWGLVTAWGDVELHADGFRAEYARVAALVQPVDPPLGKYSPVFSCAARYGVPVITMEQFLDDSFIAEFGQVVPREMRPVPVSPLDGPMVLRRPRRRDKGLRAIYGLVGAGGGTCAFIGSAWPIIAVVWIVVAMTVSTMLWPDWWDAP